MILGIADRCPVDPTMVRGSDIQIEALLPPKDRGDFNIFVYDHRSPEASGWIDNFPPDQFDYKLHADVRKDGTVAIELHRQEIDTGNISPTFFNLPGMQNAGL